MYQRSLNKNALPERDIVCYSLISDENKLQLSPAADDEPLVKYNIPYFSTKIFLIRQFHIHFIIKGNDISEIVKDDWDSWVEKCMNLH